MSTPRRRATIALVVWTLLVWTTRIGNIWRDHALTDAEKWGRTGLALSFTALAALVAVSLWKRLDWHGVAVKGLAGWTVGVWITRSVGIATGDHAGAFIAVHLVLAVISIALSVLAVRHDVASDRVAGSVPASGTEVPDH